jgi:DNA topoisomerase-2
MSKKIEDKYKVLDPISHILLRPQTYVGSNKPHTSTKWVLREGRFHQREVTVIPSFLKIFDEVLMNSVDESKRNPKLDRIDVVVNAQEGWISVTDNGGIPVEIHKDHGVYVPEVIFGNLMSGSNYDDTDQRVVAGLNGLGAKLTNVFSTRFVISTCDKKKKFYQEYTNNMRDRSVAKVSGSRTPFTQVMYHPDLEKFGLDCIDEDHVDMIRKRVVDVAACNCGLKVTFNSEMVCFKAFDEYVSMYQPQFFSDRSKDGLWSVAVGHSDAGFQQVSFVNSTETYDGGTHVDHVMGQIITELRAHFLKKHKVDVKPSELRGHMFLYLDCTIVNPSFSSQTKEKLITEQKEFGHSYQVPPKLIASIIKSEIVQSILDWVQQKKAADESKAARQLNKSLDRLKVDKLIDAKSRDRRNCQLFIFEGDSASAAFRKYRDPQTQGAFSLRGKFINAAEITTQKLVDNNEVVNLMGSLGLKLGQKAKVSDLRYGKVFLAVDADQDGNSIAALLINFMFKFWPELFEFRMVHKLETPIVIARNNRSKKKTPFFSQPDYAKWLPTVSPKDWEIKYKKGLSALVDDEYQDIIQNPRLTLISTDERSAESLSAWFGKDSEPRKVELLR